MVGIDEVGRGAWAGPLLVVAARTRPGKKLPAGLTDSKLLTNRQKNEYYEDLKIVCDFGEGWVGVAEIDEFGLGSALKIGAKRAVAELGVDETEEIIIDGKVNLLADMFPDAKAIVKADITEPIVSAASVYAKVVRDKNMRKIHYVLPKYGFKDHVGYGTQKHIQAIKDHGVTEHHRKSFKPILELIT